MMRQKNIDIPHVVSTISRKSITLL